jgi:hypothetical protein
MSRPSTPKHPPGPDAPPLFLPGQIASTPGALEALNLASRHSPGEYLRRHLRGDWGIVDAEDWATNNRAVREGTRFVSAYQLETGQRLWLITEADRRVTTFLLPEEY